MHQYLNLLTEVLEHGTRQANRTGIDAISIPGAYIKFDFNEGFPAVTTKKLFFDAVKGELLGFIRGYDNAADFRSLGCNVWNANANDPGQPDAPNRWLTNPNRKGVDDLGRVYGKQWTDWRSSYLTEESYGRPTTPLAFEPSIHGGHTAHPDYDSAIRQPSINQLKVALETIERDPTSRRIIVNAWRPDELDQMALPPCHLMYQFLVNVERKELSLCWSQRSVDCFLGLPFNIASYALLLELVANVTGYKARHLTGFLADTHIYVNHLEQVDLQLTRTPLVLPRLRLNLPPEGSAYERLCKVEPADIQLLDYQHHEPIKAEMAV